MSDVKFENLNQFKDTSLAIAQAYAGSVAPEWTD